MLFRSLLLQGLEAGAVVEAAQVYVTVHRAGAVGFDYVGGGSISTLWAMWVVPRPGRGALILELPTYFDLLLTGIRVSFADFDAVNQANHQLPGNGFQPQELAGFLH